MPGPYTLQLYRGLPPFHGRVTLPLTDHTALARSSVGGCLGRCHLSALVTRAALNKGWSPSLSSPECPPRSRIAVSCQRCFSIHHMPATVLPRSPGGRPCRTPVSCRGHVPLFPSHPLALSAQAAFCRISPGGPLVRANVCPPATLTPAPCRPGRTEPTPLQPGGKAVPPRGCVSFRFSVARTLTAHLPLAPCLTAAKTSVSGETQGRRWFLSLCLCCAFWIHTPGITSVFHFP